MFDIRRSKVIRSLFIFVEVAVSEPKLCFFFICFLEYSIIRHRSVYLIPPRSLFRGLTN
jgi:hypothetical protein